MKLMHCTICRRITVTPSTLKKTTCSVIFGKKVREEGLTALLNLKWMFNSATENGYLDVNHSFQLEVNVVKKLENWHKEFSYQTHRSTFSKKVYVWKKKRISGWDFSLRNILTSNWKKDQNLIKKICKNNKNCNGYEENWC